MSVAVKGGHDQTEDETGWRTAKYGWWNWRWLRYPENREVTGFIMAGSARGSIIGYIAVFSTLALIGLGEQVQNCITREIEFGGGATIRTSSLISTALTVEGVLNAIVSPIFGALTDATSARTTVFKVVLCSLAVVTLLTGLLLFAEGTIPVLIIYALLLVLLSICYDAFAIINNSYVPELSEDELERTLFTTKMYVLLNGNQMLYVALSVGLGVVLGIQNDKIVGPQVGVVVALFIWAFWAIPGMQFMEDRHKTAEEKVPAGFLGIPRVVKMIKLCATKYTQIGLFMAQYSIGVTGASALVGLSTGYFVNEVGLKSFDVQVVVALVLVFSIPGALLVGPLVRRVGDLRRALLLVYVYWFLMVIFVPVLLRGEFTTDTTADDIGDCAIEGANVVSRKPTGLASIMRFVLAAIWGIGLGLIYPINVALFAELIPGSSETAFFGLRTFFGKVFSWAPPLLYSFVNETAKGEDTRFSIVSLCPFLFVGLVITWFMDLEKASEQIADTLHLRHKNKAAQMRAQQGRLSIKDPMNKYDV